MYRVQQFESRKCAMHWHMHHDGRGIFGLAGARRKDAAGDCAGGESCCVCGDSAIAAGNRGLLFAGFLNAGGRLVQCKTIDMQVPANAEIVMRGMSIRMRR